jgi:hypothetical protein
MLEEGATTIIFLFGIWLSFWKGYFLQLRCFKVEICSICSKQAYSSELKNQIYLSNENHLS